MCNTNSVITFCLTFDVFSTNALIVDNKNLHLNFVLAHLENRHYLRKLFKFNTAKRSPLSLTKRIPLFRLLLHIHAQSQLMHRQDFHWVGDCTSVLEALLIFTLSRQRRVRSTLDSTIPLFPLPNS